jgi:hypothetical protein
VASSPQAAVSQPSASSAVSADPKSGISAISEETKGAATASTSTPQSSADSSRFAALARREKQIRQEKADLDAREKAFQQKEQSIKDQIRTEIAAQMKSNPASVLQEYGVDYNALTQSILNPPSPEQQKISALEAEIAQLKQGQGSIKQDIQTSQQRAYENAVQQIRNDVKSAVAKSPDFQTVRVAGQEESVVELIKQTFESTGELLSVEDACKEVEDYLFDEAIRLTSVDKVKAKLTPPPPVEANKPEIVQPSSRTLMNTLPSSGKRQPMTDAERRARAIAAFNGQMK